MGKCFQPKTDTGYTHPKNEPLFTIIFQTNLCRNVVAIPIKKAHQKFAISSPVMEENLDNAHIQKTFTKKKNVKATTFLYELSLLAIAKSHQIQIRNVSQKPA